LKKVGVLPDGLISSGSDSINVGSNAVDLESDGFGKQGKDVKVEAGNSEFD
jgi:hypothetical protein